MSNEIKPGDILIKRNDLGMPGVTLREFALVQGPYRKYGQDMIDVLQKTDMGELGRYTNMYPADQFEVLSRERIAWLNAFHGRPVV
jgi:hypothetical protein